MTGRRVGAPRFGHLRGANGRQLAAAASALYSTDPTAHDGSSADAPAGDVVAPGQTQVLGK
jgi:hypothetical protein